MRRARIAWILIALYLVGIHGALALVLWKSDFIDRVHERLGKPRPEPSAFYRKMVAFQLRADGSIPDGSIFFVGDSNTQGLCVGCVADGAVNLGIGGDTTAGVIERLRRYRSITRANAIVIAIGFNDLWRWDNETTLANYARMLDMIPRHSPIIVSPILPIDSRALGDPRVTNARIREVNRGIEGLCASTERCTLVDSGPNLVDGNGDLRSEHHVGDGVHLSTAGYKIWIEDLQNALNSIGH